MRWPTGQKSRGDVPASMQVTWLTHSFLHCSAAGEFESCVTAHPGFCVSVYDLNQHQKQLFNSLSPVIPTGSNST
jgi:hypothetical protein